MVFLVRDADHRRADELSGAADGLGRAIWRSAAERIWLLDVFVWRPASYFSYLGAPGLSGMARRGCRLVPYAPLTARVLSGHSNDYWILALLVSGMAAWFGGQRNCYDRSIALQGMTLMRMPPSSG